jgi:hypothetical protein
MDVLPKTRVGRWSVGLSAFFLAGIGISIFLVSGLSLLAFEDRWWDVTVPILLLATLMALALGLVALLKQKDRTALVYTSVTIGFLAIIFVLLHSLFISD